VNDTRSDDTIDPSKILTIIEERIDQGARRVSVSGMDDHSLRFIDDDDRAILIKDGKRKRFRVQRKGLGLGKDS
jgi:hypothetical protein